MDRLLIIDDQKGILQMLRRRFIKLGYEVFTSQNREEAFKILESTQIDLVLLDYMMPGVSGFDFFMDFKNLFKIPVIMMTAHSSIHLVVEFMRNGGVDFIEKPLDIDALHLRIGRAISYDRNLKRETIAKEKAEKKLKLANETLEVKNHELDSFTAIVSHDLRAPARNIEKLTAILKKKLEALNLDKDVLDILHYIEDGGRKMNEMTSELLEFAKMEEITKKIEDINTHELVGKIVDRLNIFDSDQTAQFSIGLLPNIKGDLILIEQVFFNLIQNAVKYSKMEKEPHISISADRNDKETTFAIKDNGVGFNMEYYVRLFNMFVRLHPQKDFEGTGIGLANVKRIVERHHGRVWAFSEEGKGATFYFSIPLEPLI